MLSSPRPIRALRRATTCALACVIASGGRTLSEQVPAWWRLDEEGPMCHETSAVPVAARILVVDDHADYAESVAKLLELLGHEVQVASDGPQAIASALLW